MTPEQEKRCEEALMAKHIVSPHYWHKANRKEVWAWAYQAAIDNEPTPSEVVIQQAYESGYESGKSEVPQWRPIEEAPKDGTEILAVENSDLDILHWEEHLNDSFFFDSGWHARDDEQSIGRNPSRFILVSDLLKTLPAPPKEEQG
mgnify:CR=1 FL=1